MAIGPDLSHRRNLMHSILQSQAVREAIKLESSEQQMSPELLEEKARAYVNEIAADYSYQVIRGLQITLNWLWNRLYDGVDVHHFDTVTQVAKTTKLFMCRVIVAILIIYCCRMWCLQKA
jgi:glycerol-3-phosphate O-acyltransferase